MNLSQSHSMKTEVIPTDHPIALQHATDVLKNGGLVVFPTDTVYGLASLAYNPGYIERLFIVKGRSNAQAIAILMADIDDLSKVAESPNETAIRLAERFWPGPLTLIVPRHPSLPEILSPLPTIGVRIPDHALARELLRRTGPLAVTSANLSGREAASTAQEALSQLGGRVHLILDGGPTPGGVASTVVDCTTKELVIVRQGPVSLEQMKTVIRG
jgi:L-threonylcarbamoyladenylate synthase